MDSTHLLFGATAINLTLATLAWTGRGTLDNADPPVLRAQAFELVDSRGKVRLQLHLGDDGSGNLRIRDGSGNVRVKLGTTTAGSTGLLLMDQTAEPTVSLYAGTSRSGVTLQGAQGKRRIITP